VIPAALTVAGSDPSGGAGIQADLKTFSALRVYGMAVITALTAQNTCGVQSVFEVPGSAIEGQLQAVLEDITPGAVKTGMLATASIVEAVAAQFRARALQNLVVDPVMISTSGDALLAPDGVQALRRHLIPLARIVTPNLAEASALTGQSVGGVDDMKAAALRVHAMGARSVYVKGGHLAGAAVDVFFDGSEFAILPAERIATSNTHGTGCVLSAAMTAYLALDEPLPRAVRLAKEFVTAAIRNALSIGHGHGPCDPIGVRQTR
jgi:hydroxymethylpyrimidine/phosphomethylpyrimidine kinase